jgi:hypothetical protein
MGSATIWLLRGFKRTFNPFHRGVVTTYALEGGAAGDRDNRDHKFSALRTARYPIHEILPIFFTHHKQRFAARAATGRLCTCSG